MSTAKAKFIYQFRHLDKDGSELSVSTFENLMPNMAQAYMMDVLFGGAAAISQWYIGLIGAAGYTPAYTDTPTYLSTNAGEITNYGTTRVLSGAARSGSSYTNAAAPAVFTFTADTTVYGAFLQSSSSFNATTGTLLSSAKAPSPKTFATGEKLEVSVTITLVV